MRLRTQLWLYLIVLHAVGLGLLVRERDALGWRFFVLEAVLVGSLLWGGRLIRLALEPLGFVRAFSDVVTSGEYNARYSQVGQSEMDQLIRTYNFMLERLQAERLRIGEQRGFLDRLLLVTDVAIVVLDFDGRISLANPAAAALLDAPGGALAGRRLGELAGPVAELLDGLERGDARVLSDRSGRRFRCHRSEFHDRGFGRTYYLIEEISAELDRSERATYEKLIRMVSHEVNNTVAATNSLLQSCRHYAPQLPDDEDRQDLLGAIDVLIARNDSLNAFSQGYANLVRLPEPELHPQDLGELVEGIRVVLTPALAERRIRLEVAIPGDLPAVALDRNQMEQVLINIVKNSMEAIGEDGRVTIAARQAGGQLVLEVIDDGPGIDPELEAQLFTPFFTTKQSGQGIGLMLAKEVLGKHGFAFSLATDQGRTRFRVRMPI